MSAYPWWITAAFVLLLIGLVVSVPLAFFTGEWRYLAITIVCFFLLYVGGA